MCLPQPFDGILNLVQLSDNSNEICFFLPPSDFCTRENWQTAVLFLAQEMELLGLSSPCTKVHPEHLSLVPNLIFLFVVPKQEEF